MCHSTALPSETFPMKYHLVYNMHVCGVKCPQCFSCINSHISSMQPFLTDPQASSCFCAGSLRVCMFCIGCECHGPPGAILPRGFEVIRPIEADLCVEILSFSVSALRECLVGCGSSAVSPALPTSERSQREGRKLKIMYLCQPRVESECCSVIFCD